MPTKKVKKEKAVRKVVRVVVEVDSTFVRLLKAEVGLANLREKSLGEYGRAELTPSQQLGLALLAEARGALEAEVWSLIMPSWRPHLDFVHTQREVRDAD